MQQKKDYPNGFNNIVITDPSITYVVKGQCLTETDPVTGAAIQTQYSIKSWEIDSPEPPDWFEQPLAVPAGQNGAVSSGSLLFFAHEVIASYGNITVGPAEPLAD